MPEFGSGSRCSVLEEVLESFILSGPRIILQISAMAPAAKATHASIRWFAVRPILSFMPGFETVDV